MNPRKAFFLLACITFLSTTLHSQNLILRKGNTKKTFKIGSFVNIVLPDKDIEPCGACDVNYVIGSIVSYKDNILTLDAIRSGQIIIEGGKQIAFSDTRYIYKEGENRIEIPENEIYSITPQGKKKYKQTSTGQGIGFAAIILSLGHLTAIPFADENSGLLTVIGLSELALGITFAAVFDQKEYVTSIHCPTTSPKPEKIWKLE